MAKSDHRNGRIFFLCGLIAIAIQYHKPAPQRGTTPDSHSKPLKSRHPTSANAPKKRQRTTWDFNAPNDTEGVTFSGEQPTHNEKDGWQNSGCISFRSTYGKHKINLTKRSLPLKITYQIKPAYTIKNHLFKTSLGWPKTQCRHVLAIFNNFSSSVNAEVKNWNTNIMYIQEHVIDTWVFPSTEVQPQRQLVLLLQLQKEMTFFIECDGTVNFDFDNLTVEEVTAEEIPDTSAFVSAYNERRGSASPGQSYPATELRKYQNLPTPIRMKFIAGKETWGPNFRLKE